jgi:hypothetical protein
MYSARAQPSVFGRVEAKFYGMTEKNAPLGLVTPNPPEPERASRTGVQVVLDLANRPFNKTLCFVSYLDQVLKYYIKACA